MYIIASLGVRTEKRDIHGLIPKSEELQTDARYEKENILLDNYTALERTDALSWYLYSMVTMHFFFLPVCSRRL